MLTDLIDKDLKVLFCGINPGLKSASDGYHFAGRSNRFWKVLHQSGFTPYQIAPANDTVLLELGYGLTTAVERATARADELSKEEFTAAFENLRTKIKTFEPRFIAFLGKAAYKAFSGKKTILWGLQPEDFCNTRVWVLPNPSGLNRGFTLEQLVTAYTEFHQYLAQHDFK